MRGHSIGMTNRCADGEKLPSHEGIDWEWQKQLYWIFGTCIVFSLYLLYHVISVRSGMVSEDNEFLICTDKPFLPWIKPYLLLITGASVGQCLALWFRHIITLRGVHSSNDQSRLRHPLATKMILHIATMKAFASVGLYSDWIPTTCIDFIGVKSHYFLWFEWLATVPYMFFLVGMMDSVKTQDRITASPEIFKNRAIIQFLGSSSMVALFFNNFKSWPIWIHGLLFIYANVAMTIALGKQQWQAHEDYVIAKTTFDKIVTFQPIEYYREPQQLNVSFASSTMSTRQDRIYASQEMERQAFDTLCAAQCKLNSAIFMSFFFILFPVLYYLQYFAVIDSESYILTTYICSYFSKILFTHLIADSHIEILDSNKFMLLEQRRQTEESRLTFLRYVFHEVRVPLNSLVLGMQLLKDSEASRDEQDTLKMMHDAMSFMSETLNDVLSMQKIQQGKMEVECIEFAIKSLLNGSLSNFRSQLDSKHIKVKILLDPKVPSKVIGDQYRIEHVLNNLLSNAIKFSDEGAEIIMSVVYERFHEGFVTFAVRDFGPGISITDQEKLFTPFVPISSRPGEVQKGKGTGLGLSNCKTIITLLGGTIGCRSKLRTGCEIHKSGSEFYFNLRFDSLSSLCSTSTDSERSSSEGESTTSGSDFPIEFYEWKGNTDEWLNDDILSNDGDITDEDYQSISESEVSSCKHCLSNDSGIFSPKSIGKRRVLICDDIFSNRKMLDMILQRKGLRCDRVSDGSQAIKLVKERGVDYYDIIFMDNIMSMVCGPDAAQTLRSLGYKNLIIGVTGNAMDSDISSFEEAGADMILTKPLRVNLLDKVLEYVRIHGCLSSHCKVMTNCKVINGDEFPLCSLDIKQWVHAHG